MRWEILVFSPSLERCDTACGKKRYKSFYSPHFVKRNRTISKVEHTFYYGHCSVFPPTFSQQGKHLFWGFFLCHRAPIYIARVFWGSRCPKKARSHNGRADRKSRKVAEFSPFCGGGDESKPFYSKSKRSISVLKALLNPSHLHRLKKGRTMVHWKKEKGPCHTQF